MNDKLISVIGGGSMGTALARMLANSGHQVSMWVYEQDLSERINSSHFNDLFLPDFELPHQLRATSSLFEALKGSELVLSVTPAQVMRKVWGEATKHLEPGAIVVCASKGVEVGSAKLMSQVLEETIGHDKENQFAYLSGPSFAKEIAQEQPTAVVVASGQSQVATSVQHAISTSAFRVYTSDDVVGVELGGAIKNVIAIAVGAAEGMGLGLNSRAALITRGLAEVSRLAMACGANPLTLAGLAGTGDLILTCTGHLSRNLQVGIRLGQGETIEQILASMNMVAEGVQTARSCLELASEHKIEMPICEAVVDLLDQKKTPGQAVQELMARKLRSELEPT